MSSQLRQRAVVSSFICTSPQSPTGLTFALFKRSDKVSTYPGKWAVCSGSIDSTDTSPGFAAKREIQEETTLDDNDISLLRKGKPFSLIDEALKTEWTIHPFAWELKSGAKSITLDWEHTEYHFIKREDIEKYEHVPQLEVGLNRVMVSPETEKALAILRNDHESGAQELALKALNILYNIVRGDELSRSSSSEDFWRELRWTAWHLAKNGRPSMGSAIESALFKALDIVRRELIEPESEGIGGIPLDNLKRNAEEAILASIEARQHRLGALASHFIIFVEYDRSSENSEEATAASTSILTLSSSGTILQSLAGLIQHLAKKGEHVKLIVLESRPMFEGVAFVNTLLSLFRNDSDILARLKIDIVSDASIAAVVKSADYFVFGGDKVLPNGDVSNKIGSLTAAVVIKTLNPACKVVALFGTEKVTGSGFDSEHQPIEYNDEAEVTDAWPFKYINELDEKKEHGFQIEVKNAYFEWVPANYIDVYVSEIGLLSKEDIARLGQETKELEERIFKDL